MSKFRKLHYYFVSAPISPVLYNAAIALAMLIPMIPDLIVMIILCYLLGARFSIVGILSLILVILLTWAVGSLLGFYIGTRVSNAMYISAIANTAGLLLETLPPVYYPLNYVSFAWKDVLLLIPTVSAAHLMRWLMESIKMPRVEAIYAFIILFVYILVFIILVQRKAEWMER
jgi:ABC-2 type transport system permease protein